MQWPKLSTVGVGALVQGIFHWFSALGFLMYPCDCVGSGWAIGPVQETSFLFLLQLWC